MTTARPVSLSLRRERGGRRAKSSTSHANKNGALEHPPATFPFEASGAARQASAWQVMSLTHSLEATQVREQN